MIVEKILSRLEGVRETGQDRWLACCPAHDDKSPSLAIREIDDRLLVHCFAGCDMYDIVSAAGLELSDLFPEKLNVNGSKPLSKPFPAADIMKCLASETTFIQLCAMAMGRGETLNSEDSDRLNLSASRLQAALLAGGLC